jgi:hypothetical protein
MTDLSWFWIAIAVVVPSAIGVLVALPLWLRGEPIFGNIAGTVVIFGGAIALMLRERVVLDRITLACLERGYTCWPNPSAFARYAIYAFIGLAEVIALFSYSLRVETRLRRRGYAPEWR